MASVFGSCIRPTLHSSRPHIQSMDKPTQICTNLHNHEGSPKLDPFGSTTNPPPVPHNTQYKNPKHRFQVIHMMLLLLFHLDCLHMAFRSVTTTTAPSLLFLSFSISRPSSLRRPFQPLSTTVLRPARCRAAAPGPPPPPRTDPPPGDGSGKLQGFNFELSNFFIFNFIILVPFMF